MTFFQNEFILALLQGFSLFSSLRVFIVFLFEVSR